MKYAPNPNTKCTCDNPRHHAKWILNEKGIIKSIEQIFKTGDIYKLTKDAYQFVMNVSGFIAHYNHGGFMAYYANVEDLRRDITESRDIANPTYWITDRYFIENEQAEYYQAKTRILQALGELATQYAKQTQTAELEAIDDKLALLAASVKAVSDDPIAAKRLLHDLSLI